MTKLSGERAELEDLLQGICGVSHIVSGATHIPLHVCDGAHAREKESGDETKAEEHRPVDQVVAAAE